MTIRRWFIMILCSSAALAGVRYPVSAIPEPMRSSDCVIREHSTRFEIDGSTQTAMVTFAITIFSREKQDEGSIDLYYDRFSSIENVEGTIFDASGEEVRDLDDDTDVRDYSAVSGGTLHEDTRVRHIAMSYDRFPYTVEYNYEIEYTESFNWPSWMAQRDEYPVQSSRFEVVTPKGASLRYWSNADSVVPAVSREGKQTLYRWSAENLRALTPEESRGDMMDVTPVVRIAPETFSVEGMKGSMTSWKEFGKWFGLLLKGRQTLSPQAQKEVAALYNSNGTAKEKIKSLYTYLQDKTRYISVQLGIGGWQPFDAMYVHERSYGDCKALTNYMQTMLKYAGIPSYPVLIKSGTHRFPMAVEFPSNQFNHVILCVPNDGDTVWLECTSRAMPFGRLGAFTEGRPCLLITPEGGVVVRTPSSSPEENLQRTSADVTVHSDGTVTASAVMTVTGNQQVDAQHALVSVSEKDRKDWLLERLKSPKAVITSLAFEGLDTRAPEIGVEFHTEFPRFANISQNRIFLFPSVLNRNSYIPQEKKGRRSPVRLQYVYKDVDSLLIHLPARYTIESLPADLELHTLFGSFRSTTKAWGDTAVVYLRETVLSEKEITLEHYDEYRSFYQKIVQSDRAKLVLVRKD